MKLLEFTKKVFLISDFRFSDRGVTTLLFSARIQESVTKPNFANQDVFNTPWEIFQRLPVTVKLVFV